ncbi:N-acetylmuramoyl-L-alanine amidase [Actinoplanes sp. NPDC051346]|uniref:N-acetylmuramoyl-L-alanine amidase n=1 Tax=Actinoplanes sp. NPDC051346 TaxID=3155048 RepID=UPI00341B79F9
MKLRLVTGTALVVAGGVTAAVLYLPSAPPARTTPESGAAAAEVAEVAAEPVVQHGDGKPVRGELHTVALSVAAGARSAEAPKRSTRKFSLLGLTWTDSARAVDGTIEVRTRSTATKAWSGWHALDADGLRGPDAGKGRGATEPLWVGPSDGVAARIRGGSGTSPLPPGLRLDLIDPGSSSSSSSSGGQGGGVALEPPPPIPAPEAPESSSPAAPPSASVSSDPTSTEPGSDPAEPGSDPAEPGSGPAPGSDPAPGSGPVAPAAPAVRAAAAGVTLPSYVSRSGWGADESIVDGPPVITPAVKVVFVHHTADAAPSDCAKSAAHIRAIHTYHTKSLDWGDIGYNFLVDRCGTLFEGRAGGVDKAVVGAQTYGFNTGSSGVAVLGTYINGGVPEVTRRVLSQLAAAKLTAYGFDPAGTATMTSGVDDGKFPRGTVVTFNRISGHRDGYATQCPGDALYAQLPVIRAEATDRVLGLTVKPPTGSVRSGQTYHLRGSAAMSWSAATPTAQISGFDVVVDGAVQASFPPGARSGVVPLTPGSHKIAVRATHISGTVETTPALTVFSDVTAPVVTATGLSLHGGTVSTTAVPVTMTFAATDNAKVAWIGATSPSTATLPATARSWATTARPGAARTFRITARDTAGNAGTGSLVRTPVLMPETAARRTGTWKAAKKTSHLNGKALTSSRRNTKLTWTFTGRAASLIAARSARSGKFDVYVDGKKVATVDTRAKKTTNRQAVWTRNLTSGRHTVTVVVRATSGRPSVTLDGLSYLR